MQLPIFGIDYAWGQPSISALKKKNVGFVIQYLSHDTKKNLTRREAEQLTREQIPIVVVWETTAKRMRAGLQAGKDDAKDAAKMAYECGMPNDRPIYFACDFDATSHDQTAINAYLKGAASQIGIRRVGLYAGFNVIKRSVQYASWFWQTYAWSDGQLHKAAQLYQYSNGHTIDGVSCDYDHALSYDYGQWYVGNRQPNKGSEMEPTDKIKIADYWKNKGVFSHETYTAEWLWQAAVGEIRLAHRDLIAAVMAQSELISELVNNTNPEVEQLKQIFRDAINSLVVKVETTDTEK